MSNEESQDVKALLLVINEKDRIIGNLSESLGECQRERYGYIHDISCYKKLVVNSQVETYNELNRKYEDLKRTYDSLVRSRRGRVVDIVGDFWCLILGAWAIAATIVLVLAIV